LLAHRLRPRLLPLAVLDGIRSVDAGDAKVPGWWPVRLAVRERTRTTSRRRHHLRRRTPGGSIKRSRLPRRRFPASTSSMPVVVARRPHLRSLTAVAAGQGLRRLPSTPRPSPGEAVTRLLQAQRRRIDDDAGAHRRADRDLLQVLALRR